MAIKIIKSVLTYTITFILVMMICGISSAWAATSGNYTSTQIGGETLSSFSSFKALNQTTPTGTSITYQFAGSNDNFQSWSNQQACIDIIDLAQISQLLESKYLKVKINLNSNDNNSPNLSGFEVSYQTSTSNNSSTNQQSSGNDNLNQAINTSANIGLNSNNNQDSSTTSDQNQDTKTQTQTSTSTITKTKTVSLSENQLQQDKLVSTGGNLWVNLGIALAITIIISLLIFYKNIKFLYEKDE